MCSKININTHVLGAKKMYDLGLKIKDLRLKRGMTQETLGRRISKSKSAICSYETNAQIPPLDVAISIASALNVSLDQLVGLDAEPVVSINTLNAEQKELIELLLAEFITPSSNSSALSQQQVNILQKIILIFASNMIKE